MTGAAAAHHDHNLCIRPDAMDALDQLDQSILICVGTNVVRSVLVVGADVDDDQVGGWMRREVPRRSILKVG